jgi:hypothetical protein
VPVSFERLVAAPRKPGGPFEVAFLNGDRREVVEGQRQPGDVTRRGMADRVGDVGPRLLGPILSDEGCPSICRDQLSTVRSPPARRAQ